MAVSIVEHRVAKETEQRSVINEAENENSSMCMPAKSDGHDGHTNADSLMGSHLIKNLELYPQTDCMIFQTPNRLGF